MFSRAVLPLIRPRAVPVRGRLLALAPSSRFYSQNNNSNKTTPTSPKSSSGANDKPGAAPQSGSTSSSPKNSESQTVQPEQTTSSQSTEREGDGVNQPKKPEDADSINEAPTSEDGSKQPDSQRPLPDLTHGIPSTIAAELAGHAKQRGGASLNLTEDPERDYEEGRDGQGDIPKNAYVSSLERRRNRLINLTFAGFLGLGIAGTMYLGRNWDTEEEEEAHRNTPSGWGFKLFFNRIGARTLDITSYYRDPAFEKLLPDDDPQFRQPYTLVLSLEDLLVHSEWSREHGWRVAKRPGVDYFLRYLNQYYELVLFTSVPSMMADQVLRKLDPYRIIRWPLFREATKYEDGEYIKDLSYLNRDLSKVILVDTHQPHAKRQPENAIILPKWKGDSTDKSLVSLIPFLEYVAGMGIDDVRPVIKSFEDTYIPVEFAKREKVMRDKFEKQLAEERAKRPKHSVGGIGSLLGIKPAGSSIVGLEDGSPSTGPDDGKMVWDHIRERGQKQYELIDKEIRENGEKWLAEMAAEEEKARQDQMKGMKSSFTGFFGGGPEKS